MILTQLAGKLRSKYVDSGGVGVNQGIHFTGGEPFLNFDLLLEVAAIAHRLGFEDEFYFSKVFKRLVGVPPSAYRHRTK